MLPRVPQIFGRLNLYLIDSEITRLGKLWILSSASHFSVSLNFRFSDLNSPDVFPTPLSLSERLTISNFKPIPTPSNFIRTSRNPFSF